MTEQKTTTKRKITLGLAALMIGLAVIISMGFAYFSDVITGNGTATAGTLDIAGTITVKQNGVAIGGTTVSNFNPGDVLSIDASTISNAGTKSAWIRAVLGFTALSSTPNADAAGDTTGDASQYLWVCSGGETQTELIAASFATGGFAASDLAEANDEGGTCLPVTTADVNLTKFGAKTAYTAPGDVISGSAESDGAGTTWTPTSLPVIYFDAAAPNAAQNGSAAFVVLIQALQYRNNSTSPSEAQWSTVVTSPFAL